MEKKNLITKLDLWFDAVGQRLEGKTFRINVNLIGSALFIIFAIVMLVLMPSQIHVSETGSVNAQTFPKLLLEIILVLSSVVFITALVKTILKKPGEVVEIEVLTELRALLILGLFILYLVLLRPLGFIISSVLFSILMTAYFREKKLSSYLVGIVAAVLVGVIFQYVLHVRLP